jgi:ribosomal protein S18 acetylase RimI-like enzyme
MSTTYYKRYRMEFDFRKVTVPQPRLPEGYDLVAWHNSLREVHARVKFECFRGEMDADVFDSLSDLSGCNRLMSDIASHEGFVPEATWLARFVGSDFQPPLLCGTIQGLRRSKRLGAVQNVGVVPSHRGLGLGRALMQRSLAGFQEAGVQRVTLEVTAANVAAVELYRSLGFKLVKTSYREVRRAAAEAVRVP